MRPTIEDEIADLTVYVRVLEDPTGGLWHNFVKCVVANILLPVYRCIDSYDSKEETGFLGLKNQGATGYMNIILQSWFHIRYFRKESLHGYSIPPF